jgi:hypothetical protein
MIRYAHITLGTVALETPNNLAVFVTDAPAKRAPTIGQVSHIPILLHGLSLNRITAALTRALKSVNKQAVLPIEVLSM